MMRIIKLYCRHVLVVMVAAYSMPASAEILWQTYSVSYLKGNHYRVGDPQREVYTFEYAASTSWGDSFMFWDHVIASSGTSTNYGEWSPRLSLCKNKLLCLQQADEQGWLKDTMLSATIEMGEGFTNYLYGVGLQFRVPGFRYANLDFYRRDNDETEDNWQTTFTWAYPFEVAGQVFLYDGFVDWFSTTQDQRSSLHWTSQLKWNLGENFKLNSPLYIGVEYTYWHNKFGIKDSEAFPTDESNANLLIKWHF
ncbi:hypothetical protein QWI17_14350 [Gilvimarinus sp. SDUM040013]|uniref:Uncharacterized protein n=1 Tax=Gilvimarinus gilvus TaxID=3058038 RepID=A0ABU4RT69_9GAMM|nr:hypothetical protein [Gilvimarinus sp. SDUM040013]MDO3387023.1 hypothetical protein [Gilvimarinus sp. SDUM040013]MDX6848083.1 hypothetical protein [Gilvimarinus sp. SDUM040013]